MSKDPGSAFLGHWLGVSEAVVKMLVMYANDHVPWQQQPGILNCQ